jgi:DNA-binding GntR family transcriptional regulator
MVMARASKKRLNPGSDEPFHDKEPRYLQLAKRIARDIRRGVYAVGELLPAEGELAKRSGLGRHTVREALRNLREVGLVSVHHGIGTRVTAAEVRPRHAFAIGAIGDFLQYVSETQLRIHRRERIPAQLASVDLPDAGEDWVLLEGLRYQKQEPRPICWTRVFIHPDYKEAARTTGKSSVPLFQQIEQRYEERVEDIEQHISAVCLTRELAGMLDAKQGSPALSTLRRYVGRNGRVLAVTVTVHPADRFRYEQRLRREPEMPGG